MSQVSFRPFQPGDLAAYAGWFADPETERRVSIPDQDWLEHVLAPDGLSRALTATLGAETDLLAVLQYDIEDDGGISLLITVDPARRGKGLGRRVLSAFIEHVGDRHPHIDGHIEADNLASIACVESCGFVRLSEEPDDGFLHYRKVLGARP